MSIAPSAEDVWLARIRDSALSADDLAALERAVRELEHASVAMRLTALVGRPVGILGSILPAHVSEIVNKSAEAAIRSALAVALRSLDRKPAADSRRRHKGAAVLAGAAGGAFGLSGLAVELPFTTMIMLRSIAEIAKNEGEDLSHPRTAIACLEVFALGGRVEAGPVALRSSDASIETGYFALRGILAKSVSEAAGFLAKRGLVEEASPAMVRFVTQVGARFGFVVSQKLAAQSAPVIGALCGAAINYAFVDHFQTLARGHFTVLRLERRYGAAVVQAEYEQILRRA
ncbi:EcsC family protein [Methylocapsa acidiphila]|uniref:EcsC family protein n=1 Tax=Methylocapsa acidiphila TaxID=133552 RepID=UPI0006873C84|nr:EcsC family protein [Methylocapsa acidiphila]